MTGMIWNAETDRKLLLFLLATNPKIKIDFEGAAKLLSEGERTCSARAVQDRFKRIRRIVGEDEKWLIVSEQAGVGHGSHAKTTYKRYHDGVEANLPLPKEGDKDSSTTGQSKKPLGTLEAEASEHDSTPKKRKKQGDDKQKGRSNLKSNEKIHDSRKKKVSNRKGKKSEEYVKETDEEDVA